MTYYCKNCNNIIGNFNKFKDYNILYSCNYVQSKNFKFINFLNCKKCKKFVGIICWMICINCFGKKEIFGEENLFNWFQIYKKKIEYSNNCKICDGENFRNQIWFFDELTFYKQ